MLFAHAQTKLTLMSFVYYIRKIGIGRLSFLQSPFAKATGDNKITRNLKIAGFCNLLPIFLSDVHSRQNVKVWKFPKFNCLHIPSYIADFGFRIADLNQQSAIINQK